LAITGACAVAAVGVFASAYVAEQRHFDEYPAIVGSPPHHDSEAFELAVIGDSWVAHQRLDPYLESALEKKGLTDVRVLSFGQGGAVSRAIYRNLFAPSSDPDSSAEVLADPAIRYGVVVAGVNDTALHIGSDFYAHHVVAIVLALLQSGITPVVVEVPEYGIENLDDARSISGKVRERLYRFLFDGGNVDGIATYREALRRKLSEEGLADRVILIDGRRFIQDYEKSIDLYRNASHLDEAGNRKLAELIVESIHPQRPMPSD